MEDYAQDFIQISDATHLDWVLLPSIGFAESSGGKRQCGDYNAFGFGQPCWDFQSYPDAIRSVANTIATSPTYKRYQETHDLAELAKRYNGADVKKWIATVTYFQEKLRAFR